MSEFKQIHSLIKLFSVGLLLVLTALTYHPAFSNIVVAGDGSNPLSRYVVFSASLAFLLNFDKQLFRIKFARRYLFVLLIIALVSLFLFAMRISPMYVNNFRDILMSFVFFSIGYGVKGSNKAMRKLIFIYSLSVAFVTLMQVIINIGGFVIIGQYISYGKNTLGVMCSSAIVAMILVLICDKEMRKELKLVYLVLSVFILILELTIRARGAMLSALVVLLYALYKQTKKQGKQIVLWRVFLSIFIGAVLISLAFPQLYDVVQTYIFDSFTLAREDDLSTGRSERNGFAFQFFLDNPLFGNIKVGSDFFSQYDVHNYLLRQLALFGVICAFPTVLLYLTFFFNIFKSIRNTIVSYETLGWFVMLVPFVVSLEEPTFPYAPGTGVVLSFVLLGFSVYKSQLVRQ